MLKYIRGCWAKLFKPPAQIAQIKTDTVGAYRLALVQSESVARPVKYQYPVIEPELIPGVVPVGAKSAIAMDAFPTAGSVYSYASSLGYSGFPGYPLLAQLSVLPEYRNMASGIATTLTREWIMLVSTESAGDETRERITQLEKALRDHKIQEVIQQAAEQDCYYGKAQILINIKGHDKSEPLILSPKTIKQNSFDGVKVVEAMWTTPMAYNALDPGAKDFYRPSVWFMMGQRVHASRLLTIITRPVLDMLKPAFNFGGISLSQLAQPYVDNWLRTRQSVSDLIHNFSITALQTNMDEILQGTDTTGNGLVARAQLFAANRDNQGFFLLDKDREQLVQINTPLGGLHELQAQAQEQMCFPCKTPSVVLIGIAPSGFGNVSEGEIKAWYDWTRSIQEAHYSSPVKTILDVMQISMFGEIDPDISFVWKPLYQMQPDQVEQMRLNASIRQGNYIDRGVVDPAEVREALARDPESGYQGLDLSKEITPPAQEELSDPLQR